jgi:AbrB family looped-hinge helix DNA binding protein
MREDVIVMSVKGQVVIPQDIRKRMKLRPKDRLIVYGEEDTIIMKKLALPELKATWKRISTVIKDGKKKYGTISQKEINQEIAAHRSGN